MKSIQLVLFDMAGTTVNDGVGGPSLVITALINSFAEYDIIIDKKECIQHRGKEKRETIKQILKGYKKESERDFDRMCENIYLEFVSFLKEGIYKLKEMDGTQEVFEYLHEKGIKIGVGSGFPKDIVERIVCHLGWRKKGLIDYINSAESIGEGRPSPKMIYHMMNHFDVVDPNQVVKVGDTVVDILEGKNAGVKTIGVLTGSQSQEDLQKVHPDCIVPSIYDMIKIL